MNVPPVITAAMSFDTACDAVISYLKEAIPLGLWSVSRFDGARQLHLTVNDDTYGMSSGDAVKWDDTLCKVMVAGAPQIAPDATAIPAYAAASAAAQVAIGTYIGIPIINPEGELFGTLCGIDPRRNEETLDAHAPLLNLLSTLLSAVLAADLERAEAARDQDRLQMEVETDLLTGLYNRRGWVRFLEAEEQQYHKFGDPGSVIVLDLDGLKEINDNKGHAAGDIVIRDCGHTLRRLIRSTDIVSRLGGDEFGVLAVNTTPHQTTEFVARLRGAFADEGIDCSIGYEHYGAVSGFAAVWEAADRSMYADKTSRRDLQLVSGA